MNTNISKRDIYQKLPQELQFAISSPENIKQVETISTKFALDEDQSNNLDDEILSFMMGLVDENEFIVNIGKRLNVNESKSLEIFKEADEKIFKEIKQLIPKNDKARGEEIKTTKAEQEIELNQIEKPNVKNLLEDAEGNRDNKVELSAASGQVSAPTQPNATQQTQDKSFGLAQGKQAWWMKSVVSEDKLTTNPNIPPVRNERASGEQQAQDKLITNDLQPTTQPKQPEKSSQTFASQNLGGQTKDVIDEAYEKPTAQDWGTVVDQRLGAQSKEIKNENSWEVRKARLVSEPDQKRA